MNRHDEWRQAWFYVSGGLRCLAWLAYFMFLVFVLIVWIKMMGTSRTVMHEQTITAIAVLAVLAGFTVAKGVDSMLRW